MKVKRESFEVLLKEGDLVCEFDSLIPGVRRSRITSVHFTRMYVFNPVMLAMIHEEMKKKIEDLLKGYGSSNEVDYSNSILLRFDYSWFGEELNNTIFASDLVLVVISGEIEVKMGEITLVFKREGWISLDFLKLISKEEEFRVKITSRELKAIASKRAEVKPEQTFRNILYGILNSHPNLSKMDRRTSMNIIEESYQKSFSEDEVVCRQGEYINTLMVVLQGTVRKGVELLGVGHIIYDFTGGISIRSHFEVCGAEKETIVGCMSMYKLMYAMRSLYEIEDCGDEDFVQMKRMMYVQHDHLYDEFICRSGEGVYFVNVFSKQDVREARYERQLANEKKVYEVLKKVDTDGTCGRLVKRMACKNTVVCIYTYINGSPLRRIMRKVGCLTVRECRFVVSGVVRCLQVLHENRICVRDLKPESIVVRKDAKILVSKLCASKYLEEGNHQFKCHTMVGTPHYMSVEMIKREEYGFAVDVWSLGIILYEMMTGVVPFGETTDDPMEVYEAILYKKMTIPSIYNRPQYDDLRSMISMMLDVNPTKRYEVVSSRYFSEEDGQLYEDIVEGWAFLSDVDSKVKKLIHSSNLLNLFTDEDIQYLSENEKKAEMKKKNTNQILDVE